jgi:hypothetical protein
MSLHPLVEEALEAHGGADRWRHYRGVSSTIVTGGQLWSIKQAPLIAGPRRATIQFDPQRTQVTPFGQPGRTMHWAPDGIEVTDAEGAIVAARDHPRDAINRSFDAAWDPLHLAYFNGYAMWTYHAVPFVFSDPAYLAREIEPVWLDGEILRGVAVRFPDGIHSHSREQRFYFGADGLLRRHDYEVDIWANMPAAQLLTGYVDVDGLKFPTRRRAYHRLDDGTPDLSRNYVAIDLSDYALLADG